MKGEQAFNETDQVPHPATPFTAQYIYKIHFISHSFRFLISKIGGKNTHIGKAYMKTVAIFAEGWLTKDMK